MKKTTKKSPTGAPLGNPLKFFREGGEKIKTMFKTGGYNVPTQSLPKANKGRAMRDMDKYLYADPVGRERVDGPGPYANPYTPKPNYGPITEEEAMFRESGKPNFSNGPIVVNTPSSSPRGMGNTTMKPRRPIVDPMRVMPNTGKVGPYGNTTEGPIGSYEEKNGGMMKKGGATKSKKFAALARPFNKATAADRIAGAKKNVKKK